jgi:hypothetical protein
MLMVQYSTVKIKINNFIPNKDEYAKYKIQMIILSQLVIINKIDTKIVHLSISHKSLREIPYGNFSIISPNSSLYYVFDILLRPSILVYAFFRCMSLTLLDYNSITSVSY